MSGINLKIDTTPLIDPVILTPEKATPEVRQFAGTIFKQLNKIEQIINVTNGDPANQQEYLHQLGELTTSIGTNRNALSAANLLVSGFTTLKQDERVKDDYNLSKRYDWRINTLRSIMGSADFLYGDSSLRFSQN